MLIQLLLVCLITGAVPLCAAEESLEKIFGCLADRIYCITQLNGNNNNKIQTELAAATEKVKHRFEINRPRPETDQASFFMACSIGNQAIVNLFLDADFNIEARNKGGQTPLMIAAYTGNYDAVKSLLARNADVMAVDTYNKSAKDYAFDIPHQLNNMGKKVYLLFALLPKYESALQRYAGMNPFDACKELIIKKELELIAASTSSTATTVNDSTQPPQ